jgi:hypothetical protein
MKGKVLRHLPWSGYLLEKLDKVSEIFVEFWLLRIQTTHDFSAFNFEDIFLAMNALVFMLTGWQIHGRLSYISKLNRNVFALVSVLFSNCCLNRQNRGKVV